MSSETAAKSVPAYNAGELVARIRAGDESAWRAMSVQYEPLLRWELGHFREWYLEALREVKLPASDSETLERGFDWLASRLASLLGE